MSRADAPCVRGPQRRCARVGEHGLTLVELLVALLILGVILAAGASSLINFSRTSAVNVARVQGSAYLTSLHESLQGVPWHRAAIYEDELTATETLQAFDELDADHDVPTFDLEASPPTWDGEPIVTMPAPDNSDCPPSDPECARRPFVPRPFDQVEIDGRDFDVFQLVTQRGAVANIDDPELKRFVTVVRWELLGRTFIETFESQRAATPAELSQLVPADVRQFLVAPNVIELDDGNANSHPITVMARFRPGSGQSAVLRIPTEGGGITELDPANEISEFDSGVNAARAFEWVIAPGGLAFDPCPDGELCTREVEVIGQGPAGNLTGRRSVTLVAEEFAIGDPRPTVDEVFVLNVVPTGDLHVGVDDGISEDVLCGSVTMQADVTFPEADLDASFDANNPDAAGVRVRGYFTSGLGPQYIPMQYVIGSVSSETLDGVTRYSYRYELELPAGAESPWLLGTGDSYKDRFFVIARSAHSDRSSTYEPSQGVLTIEKPGSGQCPS